VNRPELFRRFPLSILKYFMALESVCLFLARNARTAEISSVEIRS
jgi:hypothetical protein